MSHIRILKFEWCKKSFCILKQFLPNSVPIIWGGGRNEILRGVACLIVFLLLLLFFSILGTVSIIARLLLHRQWRSHCRRICVECRVWDVPRLITACTCLCSHDARIVAVADEGFTMESSDEIHVYRSTFSPSEFTSHFDKKDIMIHVRARQGARSPFYN